MTAKGPPLGFAGIWASPVLGRIDLPGVLAQPMWLDPASVFAVALLGFDAAGIAAVTWPIPSNPALVGATLWLQAAGGPQLPVPTSAVPGGMVR